VTFHAVVAPFTYWAWDRYLRDDAELHWNWALWAVLMAYVAVPLALGLRVGSATRRKSKWTKWIVGIDPAPTSWDCLWSEKDRSGYVRVKFKAGGWAAGLVGPQARGFASSYPAAADVFVPVQVEIDPTTGEIPVDDEARPKRKEWGLLMRWDEIEHLEFQEIEKTDGGETARDSEARLRARQRQARI
jgi:hypothetical protein